MMSTAKIRKPEKSISVALGDHNVGVESEGITFHTVNSFQHRKTSTLWPFS